MCLSSALFCVSAAHVYCVLPLASSTSIVCRAASSLCLLSVSMYVPVLDIELLVYLREDAMHHHLSNSHAYVYGQHAFQSAQSNMGAVHVYV
jgi:hypothetical protein